MTVNSDQIIVWFRDKHLTLTEISLKRHSDIATTREILIRALGLKEYRYISRRNGGFRAFLRIRRTRARYKKYCIKMGRAVASSLHIKMQDHQFKRKWGVKAAKGSRKGLLRLKELLANQRFREEWRVKCRLGGCTVFKQKKGIHNPKLKHARMEWSVKGLLRTGRKAVGPNGELMYNVLEAQVARVLATHRIPYVYERRVRTDTLNGFITVDFSIDDRIFLEVSCWDRVEEKCTQLRRKYDILHAHFNGAHIAVVTNSRLKEEYQQRLGSDINVYSVKELPGFIQSIAG